VSAGRKQRITTNVADNAIANAHNAASRSTIRLMFVLMRRVVRPGFAPTARSSDALLRAVAHEGVRASYTPVGGKWRYSTVETLFDDRTTNTYFGHRMTSCAMCSTRRSPRVLSRSIARSSARDLRVEFRKLRLEPGRLGRLHPPAQLLERGHHPDRALDAPVAADPIDLPMAGRMAA
jgi:hypothetical protein